MEILLFDIESEFTADGLKHVTEYRRIVFPFVFFRLKTRRYSYRIYQFGRCGLDIDIRAPFRSDFAGNGWRNEKERPVSKEKSDLLDIIIAMYKREEIININRYRA